MTLLIPDYCSDLSLVWILRCISELESSSSIIDIQELPHHSPSLIDRSVGADCEVP